MVMFHSYVSLPEGNSSRWCILKNISHHIVGVAEVYLYPSDILIKNIPMIRQFPHHNIQRRPRWPKSPSPPLQADLMQWRMAGWRAGNIQAFQMRWDLSNKMEYPLRYYGFVHVIRSVALIGQSKDGSLSKMSNTHSLMAIKLGYTMVYHDGCFKASTPKKAFKIHMGWNTLSRPPRS